MTQGREHGLSVPAEPPWEYAWPGDGKPVTTRDSLYFAYGGYFFRYIYLLILIPYYGRVLGATEYGKVLAAMSLFSIVWLAVNYGFSIVGTRDIAATLDRAVIGREFGRQVKARLLLSVIGVAIGAAGTLFSEVLRAEPLYGLLATLLGLLTAFNLGWYFQGTQRFRTSILIEVAGFAISLVLILTLVHDRDDGLLVMLSLVLSAAATTTAAYAIALGQIGFAHVRFSGARALLKSATAMFVSDGVSRLMMTGSTLLLSLFATATQVAYFGAAERIASLGLSLMVPANQVMVGTVARGLSQSSNHAATYSLMRKALRIFGLFGVFACIGALLLSPVLIPLVFGAEFQPSIAVMQIFAFVFPLAAFNQVIRLYVLLPLRMDRLVARATLLGAVCTLLGIPFLAADFHGYGVAAARVAGELVTAVALLVILQQQGLFSRLVYFPGRKAVSAAAEPGCARIDINEQTF